MLEGAVPLDFLKLWKNADPDVSVLKKAKAEYRARDVISPENVPGAISARRL
jgi:hypothetical protein